MTTKMNPPMAKIGIRIDPFNIFLSVTVRMSSETTPEFYSIFPPLATNTSSSNV
jgi:hypothetical protein